MDGIEQVLTQWSPHALRAEIERLRAENQAMKETIEDLAPKLTAAEAKVEGLERESENLRQQAMNHATEARCQRSTVHEMYELVTGKTGEPGDWNGAEPLRKFLRSHCVITTDQIDAAAEKAELARDVTYDTSLDDGWGWEALNELGIKRCEGCNGSGGFPEKCHACNGHGWTRGVNDG